MPAEIEMPTVSVCVTTYQHAAFIRQCLESVLTQVFPGTLELLVGDDGSQDGTREILHSLVKAYPQQLRVFLNDSNLGPSGNLSHLVQKAKGLFVCHLDGDDFWLPGKLSAQLALLQTFPNLSAAYTNAYVINAANHKLGLFNRAVPSVINLHELVRRGNFLNHSSLLYRSSASKAVLGINNPYIDYRIHIRLLHYGELGYIDLPLVCHRWRTVTSMIKSMPRLVHEGYIDAFKEMIISDAEHHDVESAISWFWGKLLLQAIVARKWNYLNEWRQRLLSEPALGFSKRAMVIATIMTIPRAVGSFWRRKFTDHSTSVYFP